MKRQKGRPPQSSTSARHSFLNSRLDTSQTIQKVEHSDSTASISTSGTASNRGGDDDGGLSIPISSFPKGAHSSDGWAKSSAIGQWIGVGIAFLGAFATVVWLLSKMDSNISNTQTEMRDVRVKVDKIVDDSSKQGARLEKIEQSVIEISGSVREISKGRKDR